jgi:hypothetical protein
MEETYTIANTEVYSASDVKAVMQNTYEDIIGFANRKLIDYSRVKSWIEDLVFLLNEEVLKSFEIQLYNSSNIRFRAYRYVVNTYGYINSGSSSGGINYFEIPNGTVFGLSVDVDFTKANAGKIKKHLYIDRNWGKDGTSMEGTSLFERSHSSGSLELKRYVVNK